MTTRDLVFLKARVSASGHPLEELDEFGQSVAVSQNGLLMVVGVPGEDTLSGPTANAGVVAIYTRASTSSAFVRTQTILNSIIAVGFPAINFGALVAIDDAGDTIAVSTTFAPDASYTGGGSPGTPMVEIYRKNGSGVFVSSGSLSIGTSQWPYALDVAGDGNTLASAEYFEGGSLPNRVAILQRNTTTGAWSFFQSISASGMGKKYGISTSLSTDGLTLVVGEPDDRDAVGAGNGAVYVYTRASTASNFTLTQTINTFSFPAGGSYEPVEFGYAVSISGDANCIVIGAPGAWNNVDYSPNDGGLVFVFKKVLGSYVETSRIQAVYTIPYGNQFRFGAKVSVANGSTSGGTQLYNFAVSCNPTPSNLSNPGHFTEVTPNSYTAVRCAQEIGNAMGTSTNNADTRVALSNSGVLVIGAPFYTLLTYGGTVEPQGSVFYGAPSTFSMTRLDVDTTTLS